MNMDFQDSMAVCHVYGSPDLFVSFTCNPNWPKIVDALRPVPGQRPLGKSDMEYRVFNMKLNDLFHGIKSVTVSGPIHAGTCIPVSLSLAVFYPSVSITISCPLFSLLPSYVQQ